MINVGYCFNSMESLSYCKLNFQCKSGTQVVRFMDEVWQASLSLRNSTISFSILIVADGNLVFLCRSSPLLYLSGGSSTGARILEVQGNVVIFSLSARLLWMLNHSSGQRFLFFSLLCRQPELDFKHQWLNAPQTLLTYSLLFTYDSPHLFWLIVRRTIPESCHVEAVSPPPPPSPIFCT